MVERFRNDIREQIPEVDAVIGTGEIEKILQACEGQLRLDDSENVGGAELPTYLYHDATPRILATPRHTAYIKINEGCDHPCTFCVIPQLRGCGIDRTQITLARFQDFFDFAGADDGIHFWNLLADFIAIAFHHASGDN